MSLTTNNLKATAWSRTKSKKVGRGNGSGKWTYSTRWCKGQNARSGGWVAPWFEWGQTPLFRRLPKLKGFSNAMFKKEYNIINLKDLEILASAWSSEINKDLLLEKRVIRKKTLGIKLLANGEITKPVVVKVSKASKTAIEAIEKAWGKVELV